MTVVEMNIEPGFSSEAHFIHRLSALIVDDVVVFVAVELFASERRPDQLGSAVPVREIWQTPQRFAPCLAHSRMEKLLR